MVKIVNGRTLIITLTSGLGNQMFQYALYDYLKHNGHNVVLVPFDRYLTEHNGYELTRLFGDNIERPISNAYLRLIIRLKWFIHGRWSRGLSLLKINFVKPLVKMIPYDIVVFPTWKDYTFIPKLGDSLFEIFKFPKIEDSSNLSILKQIKNTESVSIHVRRGDFQNVNKWRKALGDICDIDYYRNAVGELKNHVPNPIFFVFSDDIDWVKNNLPLESAYYVDWNKGSRSYIDLVLMAECKHNILSNSTFSLWGAWLNKNREKTVIVPKKWQHNFNDKTRNMYVHPSWVIIDNEKPYISLLLRTPLNERQLKYILSQQYTDFEIIPSNEYSNIDDYRIKTPDAIPQGYFSIEISEKEIKKFSNKKYLGKLLDRMMNKERFSK